MRTKSRAGGGEYKMVLVVRGELRLTPGKAAVQVAHAAVMLALATSREDSRRFQSWLEGGQKKIAVVADTLPELEELARGARARGIPYAFVEDAGLTEVAPGTRTVLGLGPATPPEVDPLTGHLPLL